MEEDLENPTTTPPDDIDSCCSTPYVSAPSSPGRAATGFYYSAPTSPMHFALSSATTSLNPYPPADASFEFDFSATLPSAASADELFFNGQIRPMKLSTHLQRPQFLTPLIESDEEVRGRDPNKFRAGSIRRRTRSMSPNRVFTTSFQWNNHDDENNKRNEQVVVDDKNVEEETTPCASRSSSAGRSSSSKKWVFLKELLYRSKSEGRNDGHKFWGTMSFSPAKEKKLMVASTTTSSNKGKVNNNQKKKAANKNGLGKRNSPSPHELHYTAKRAQAEEMRKKTFLPYRQGLLGCLGFNSKSYGAINGFARAFNHVSST